MNKARQYRHRLHEANALLSHLAGVKVNLISSPSADYSTPTYKQARELFWPIRNMARILNHLLKASEEYRSINKIYHEESLNLGHKQTDEALKNLLDLKLIEKKDDREDSTNRPPQNKRKIYSVDEKTFSDTNYLFKSIAEDHRPYQKRVDSLRERNFPEPETIELLTELMRGSVLWFIEEEFYQLNDLPVSDGLSESQIRSFLDQILILKQKEAEFSESVGKLLAEETQIQEKSVKTA